MKYHEPVLVSEVLEAFGLIAPLQITGKYIDATLGHAGHAIAIAKAAKEVLGIEADQETLEEAKERLIVQKVNNIRVVKGNFRNIDLIAKENGFINVDGILFDLGANNEQLTSSARGFSFNNPKANLDMRLDKETQKITASELLNLLRLDQLIDLFGEVITKGDAIRLSREVVRHRESHEFEKVGDLTNICDAMFEKKGKLNPATKVFLALRIAVNSEMDNLVEAMPKAFELLKSGGRLVIISFHSTEHEVVTTFLRKIRDQKLAEIVNYEPIVSGYPEVLQNPRSRSAKLNILEKC